MSQDKPTPTAPAKPVQAREDRLAEALRRNLRRRKAPPAPSETDPKG